MNFIKNKSIIRKLLFLLLVLSCTGVLSAQHAKSDTIQHKEQKQSIAYSNQYEWEVTSAISTIQGDALTKSFAINVANTLYARLPGLTVGQKSGEPGNDSPELNSRGLGTFGSGQDITIIIDGFPSTYEFFQQLTPYEIESINLLKDAASAAIYGNKAANGVLLVKTKRGLVSPLKLNAGVRYGIQQITRLPEFLDAYNYAKLYNEARVNDFGPGSETYTEADLNLYQQGSSPYTHPNVNWYKELLREQTPMSDFNLTAQGGSNTIKYFVLLNLANNQGILKKTKDISGFSKDFSYTRYNFRTNVDIQLSSILSSEITLGGNIEDRINPGRLRDNVSGEYSTNIFNLMSKVPSNAFPIYLENGQIGGNSIYQNPWAEITETGYYSTNKRSAQLLAKLNANLSMITPGLNISGSIGFNTLYKSYTIAQRDYARFDINNKQSGEMTSLSINDDSYSQWRNLVFQGIMDYDRTFDKHHISALLMGAYEELSQSASGALPFKDIVTGGRLTYSFDKRYIGEFSFGYDGTDNFAPGKRFGFFPAASVGWIVSNESFLNGSKTFDFLKLRVSYGLTGNKDNGSSRFPYNQYYKSGNYYFGQSNTSAGYYTQNYYANEDATWEKDKKFNVGVDAKIINSLSFKFDYFHATRYDILTTPYNILPSFVGFIRPEMNVGNVVNQGFESVLRYEANTSKNINWFVEASAWFARNKIIYNGEAPKSFSYQYTTGNRINQPFLLEATGFFNNAEDIQNSAVQTFTSVQPGDLKYKNQNPESDNRIDNNDLVPVGYTDLPELTLGLHSGFNYKGFDMDVLFNGALNRSVYWSGSYFNAFQNNGQISSIALGRWTEETKSTATYPRLSSENNMNNFQRSSFWQKDGSFLKLRSLELGYTLPEKFSKKNKFSEIRFFLNGTNLFSLDHMDGFTDPETITGYPAMRTISLGLGIQL